jgi:hypothetical protein
MTKTLNRMADLYSRLSDIGFPPKYVREVALPDWWCDEFEQSDGAVINAASYAARRLNLDLDSLLKQGSVPSFNLTGKPKFKTIKGSDCNKFTIATALCNRIAELVSTACINEYQPLDNLSIQQIRGILLSNNGIVCLESVLKFCWQIANCAKQIAERDRIAPGLIAWNYGWEKDKKDQWGITRNAVSILELEANAPLQINQYLQDQLDWDRLSDDNQYRSW